MSYRGLALINGLLIAVMVFLNGMLGERLGTYNSAMVFYGIGLLLLIGIHFIKKLLKKDTEREMVPIHEKGLKKLSLFILPGILSAMVIVLNNVTVTKVGVTLTLGLGAFGQVIMSNIVQVFGLFGTKKVPFNKKKLIAYAFIVAGIAVMTFF